MLWTDRGSIIGMQDLTNIESEIPSVAASEGIDVNVVLAQAQLEVIDKIDSITVKFSSFGSNGSVSNNHMMAIRGRTATNRQRVRRGQIVTQDFDRHPLINWIAYETVVLFYRTAAGRSSAIADRYRDLYKQFGNELRTKYYPRFFEKGLPIVTQPLPCPGAVGERGSGTWTAIPATKTGAIGGTYDVSITYINSPIYLGPSMMKKMNGESAPSSPITVTTGTNQAISSSIVGLAPPDGTANISDYSHTFAPALTATHWNIYAGLTGSTLYLQNVVPIPLSTPTYLLPSDPILTGYAADLGQVSDQTLFLTNTLFRG